MSDSMVERVALAIRNEIAHPHGDEFMVEGGFRSERFFTDIARAAITALQEPTRSVISAVATYSSGFEFAEYAWRAGVDEALRDA